MPGSSALDGHRCTPVVARTFLQRTPCATLHRMESSPAFARMRNGRHHVTGDGTDGQHRVASRLTAGARVTGTAGSPPASRLERGEREAVGSLLAPTAHEDLSMARLGAGGTGQ